MAAVASSEDTVLGDPNFAVICSFLQKFGDLCGAADFSVDFLHLQRIMEDTRSVHVDLIDLHVRLLRKLGRKNITHEKWELSLVKYCHGYSKVDAWEIERFGYKKSKLSVKINLLKRLLESQFDRNGKLKSEVNKLSAEQLRTLPIGKDVRGQLYWFQVDDDLNLRVYREDQDEETFELVVRERDDLITLIENLVTNTNLGAKKEEDSTTPSDTGDSKDGEASLGASVADKQDVKVSEENLHFCVKAADVEEDALSGFPKIAADLQIKREPKDLSEDLKPNEFVAIEIKDESSQKEEAMDIGGISAASGVPSSVLETKDTDLKSDAPSTATESCAVPAAEDLSKSSVIEKSDYSKSTSVVVLPARMSVIKMANAGICGDAPQDRASSRKDASSADVTVTEPAACISKCFSDDGAITTAPVITEAVSCSAALTQPPVVEEIAPRIEKAAERRTMPFKKRGIPKNLKTSDDKTVLDAPPKDVEKPVEPSIVAVADDLLPTKMTVDKKTDDLFVDKKTDDLSVDKKMAEDVVLKQQQRGSSSPSTSALDAEKESAAEVMEDMMKRIEIKVLSEESIASVVVVAKEDKLCDNASITKADIACFDRLEQEKTLKLDNSDSPKVLTATENVAIGRLCDNSNDGESGRVSKAKIATNERQVVQPTVVTKKDDASTSESPTGDQVLTLKSVISDERQDDDTKNQASEVERTYEMVAVNSADVSVENVDDDKCEKRAKDGAVPQTKDAKISETRDVKLSKTKDVKKDAKKSETKDVKMSELSDVKKSKTKDAKIPETKDAKISETKDAKMSETKDAKMSETKDAKMSEISDAKMSETKDVKTSETKDAKMSEISDVKMSEAKDVKMSEAKDAKISETKDTKMSEVKDAKMSEVKDAKMSETKDIIMSETRDAKMSEISDAKMSKTKNVKKDAKMLETIDVKMSEAKVVKMSELSDAKMSETKDAKMSETKDVKVSEAEDVLMSDAKNSSEPKDIVKDDSESAEVDSKDTQVESEKVAEKSPSPNKESRGEVEAEAPPEQRRGRGRRPKARGGKGGGAISKSAVSVPVDVPASTEKPVDGDGEKKEAGEGEPEVPPPTTKKPRGRRRRKTEIIAEAAATEANDHMERPERIQPKRSCRLEAQRVKQVEDERRIEEALQREAMLVQHRLHEERKRKELQAGASATTATTTTTTGGTSSVLSLTNVVGTKPSNGQVKQAGRRRKNAKVTASSVKEDAKAASKKDLKKTGPGRGKRRKLNRAPPPPPPQQLAATNGSNGRSKKRKAGYNPWDCSSESSAASSCVEEDEEYGMEEPEESDEELVFNEGSDHEFSPESESDNSDDVLQPMKLKRARTVRRVKSDNEEGSTDESDDDKPCSKCDKYDHPEWILLCDKCDNGFHASCLRPPLMLIPDGDWFCPPCDHKMLVEKLQEQLKNLDQLWKKKEREEMRKKRLAYVGISLDNVLKPEKRETEDEEHDDDDGDGGADDDVGDYLLLRKRSRRARKEVSYRFKEFDELIDSAIQDETSLGVALLAVQPPPTPQQHQQPSLPLPAPPPSSVAATPRPNAVIESGAPEVLMSGWSSRLTQQWVRVQQEHGFRFGGDGLLQETPLRANFGKGKDLATIIASEKAETEETKVESVTQTEDDDKKKDDDEEEGDDDDGEDELVVVRKAKKKHRRLNDLDSPSDDDDSDEDFKGSGSESEHPSEDESGAGAEETDDSWKDNHGGRGRSQRSGGGRRRRSDDDFVVDDSDESLDAPRTVRRAAAKSVNYRELSDSDDGRHGNKKKLDYHSTGRKPARIESDESSSSEDSDWKKKKKKTSGTAAGSGSSKKSHRSKFSAFAMINRRKSRTIDSDDDDDDDDDDGGGGRGRVGQGCSSGSRRRIRTKSAKSYEEVSDDSEDARPKNKKKARLDVKDFELDSNERSEDSSEEEDEEDDDDEEEEDDGDVESKEGVEVKSKMKRVVCVGDSDDEPAEVAKASENVAAKDAAAMTKTSVDDGAAAVDAIPATAAAVAVAEKTDVDDRVTSAAAEPPPPPQPFSSKDPNKYSVIKSVESVKKELLKQTSKCPPIRSSHSRPFPSSSSQQQQHVAAIASVSAAATVQVLSSREEGSLQKLESLAKGPDDGAPSYQDRLRAPDYQNRPSPLKPSVMEAATYPVRSSPSKLMLLDTAYTTSSKLTTLEPYNAGAATSSPSSSGGLQPYDRPSRLQGPPPQFHPPPEYGGYPPGQYYPPPNYPPQPPGAHQYGYQPPPPNPYPQYHHHHHHSQQQQHHAMNYNYMPQGYGGEQGPYSQGPPPQYGGGGPGPYGNYSSPPPPSSHPPPAAAHQQPPLQQPPPPPSASSSSSQQQQPPPSVPGSGSGSAAQQVTSLPNQPNGRFSIENLLQRRIEGAAAGEDDEFSTVNDLVSYITGSSSHDTQL